MEDKYRMEKLLIIDSNSILNRAFYGIRYLSAKNGTPTNAIYGFLNILLKLVDEQKPDYVCAAFDLKAPTFRHKMYKEYKAQRKPMPEDLALQMPIAKDILRAMNIHILEMEGYEADDIIGTVSQICEKNNIECMIATGDKDDLQLASDKTKVILTISKSGVNETIIYDDKAVLEKYHVTPSEFIDVKALMGDKSDNIPGVDGIGEKTAISLVEKYKNIEYIYDNIDEIYLKGAMLERLKKGRENAFLSKKLATIDREVPIDFNLSLCSLNGESLGTHASLEFTEILQKLALYSIIKRLGGTKTVEKKKDKEFFDKFNFSIIYTKTDAEEFVKKARDIGMCACVFKISDNIIHLGLATGNYAVQAELNKETEEPFFELLKDETVKKVMFGVKNIIVMLNNEIRFSGIFYDVELAAYLIDPAKGEYDIFGLAEDYLGVFYEKKENMQLSLFDDDNEEDEALSHEAACLIPLMHATKEIMKNDGQLGLYEEIELPLSEVLAGMQIEGVKIDKVRLKEFSNMLESKISMVKKEIYELSGEEFNLNSPKQLGVILFEKLDLKSIKKTKSGYSTNIEVLEKIRDKHPIVPLIMEYRQFSKLKSTYCDGLSMVIDKKDGRIHSNFTQTVTVTGRISSTEPNMQNIPVRTELGREIRKMFIAKEGNVLIDADYSQIELRVLAHISNDKTMIEAFINDEDIHAVTAAQVLGISQSEVTTEQRGRAKAVNFGIVYGMGEYSLSQDIHVSVKEAKEYIAGYFEKYSGVHKYMDQIKKQAENDGYVKTLMNRIRYIPELKSSNHNTHAFGERVALNTPIQGTAADIIKLAMVRVYKRLLEEKMESHLILQVHDELIIEAPEKEKEKAAKILKEEMENAISLKVPLKVDLNIGKSWYDAK